jgi:hypothetical protein
LFSLSKVKSLKLQVNTTPQAITGESRGTLVIRVTFAERFTHSGNDDVFVPIAKFFPQVLQSD